MRGMDVTIDLCSNSITIQHLSPIFQMNTTPRMLACRTPVHEDGAALRPWPPLLRDAVCHGGFPRWPLESAPTGPCSLRVLSFDKTRLSVSQIYDPQHTICTNLPATLTALDLSQVTTNFSPPPLLHADAMTGHDKRDLPLATPGGPIGSVVFTTQMYAFIACLRWMHAHAHP